MIDISIITINYNDIGGLNETIESVIHQDYDNFEYIIIDGGSEDGSKQLIEKYADHVNFWSSEKDDGIYHAMNKGLLKAKGKYVLFLNSGDTFYSNSAIRSFESFFKTVEYDVVYGDISILDGSRQWLVESPSELTFNYLAKDTLPFPCTIIKRETLLEFKFDESLKIVSDWKFFILILCKYDKKYKHVPATIVNFKLGGISSTNPELVAIERRDVLENYFSFFIDEFYELQSARSMLQSLRKSRKIKWLQKFGLLNKF